MSSPCLSLTQVTFASLRNHLGLPDDDFGLFDAGDIDQSPSQDYLLEHRHDTDVAALFDMAMAKRPSEELYDIISDPACLENLAESQEFAEEKKRLSNQLDKYLVQTADPRAVTGESVWDQFPYYFQNYEGIVPYSNIKLKE